MAMEGWSQHRIGDFMVYGNNNGLPPSLYYSVCQTSDGYLWIGSSSGLVRFDGKRYEILFSDFADTSTIADNVITDLVEDQHGNLWLAGFYQGISKYNLRTGKVKRYPHPIKGTGHAYGLLKVMKDPEGHIWVGTKEHGLGHYNEARDDFEYLYLDHTTTADVSHRGPMVVSDIAIDPQDHNILWVSGYDGLYAFHKKQKIFERYAYYAAEPKNQITPFLAVETDSTSKIWLGTWSDGLVSFDKNTKTFESYPYAYADVPNTTSYQVMDVKSTNDTTLYLASRNAGLLIFHKATNSLQPLITNEMLPDGSSGIDIQQISITPDAGVFVGGNYYLYQQHAAFNRFSNSWHARDSKDFSLFQSVFDSRRSGYWVASWDAGGILFFSSDMSSHHIYPSPDPRDLLFVDVAIDHQSTVWVVSFTSGLLKLDERDGTFKRALNVFPGSDTIAHQVIAIEPDKEGNLWLATNHILYYWSIGKNTLQEFKLTEDKNSPLGYIKLYKGSHQDAWISTNHGLFHCALDQSTVTHLLPDATDRNSIAHTFVKSLTVDHDGNAWVGFESDGIQVVSHKDHTILARYTLRDGLPGMQINQMATDSAGRIWVGTSAGLALFNPYAEERVWQLFNREDGVKRDYIDRIITTTTDGKLFFNIDNGFSWIDIGHEHFTNDSKPILHVVSLLVNGEPYLKKDVLPEHIQSLSLPYSIKEISIEYAAMDWLHPFRTKYFYRIEGISQSNEWTENHQAMITLTGMKAGKYVLQIFAVNGEGIKSEVLELPIVIQAPFWQRWWFVLLSICLILLIGYAIYQYRIRQFKKLQDMRNTISTNLHDDIGASLSNIHILTVLTQRNISNPADASSYISKAGDEIQRISESLSDIVWNINPKYDDLDQLFIRMKRYAADMFDGKNIRAELIFPDSTERLSMPMDQRRDFYLIFKEAVNNLVKYADATTAIVKVTTEHHMIHMEVSDNGIGFEEGTMGYGNGLENMKQRAEKWKATLVVRSVPTQGTSILLDMKVSQA